MAKDEWYVDGAHDDSYLRDIPGDGKRELARSAHRRETIHDPAHDYAYEPMHATQDIGEDLPGYVTEAQEYIKETDFDVRTLQDKALVERQKIRAAPAPEQERTSPVANYLNELDEYTKK